MRYYIVLLLCIAGCSSVPTVPDDQVKRGVITMRGWSEKNKYFVAIKPFKGTTNDFDEKGEVENITIPQDKWSNVSVGHIARWHGSTLLGFYDWGKR